MKKILALILVLMMCFASTAALAAELQTAEIQVEALEGTEWIFEDYGFSLTIPEILAQVEVPAEYQEGMGIFDCYALADGSAYMMLGETELTSEDAITNLVASLQADASFSDIGILTINGTSWLTYTQADSNLLMFSSDVNGVLLTFYCSPANDEGFQATLLCILGSVTPVEAEAAAQ